MNRSSLLFALLLSTPVACSWMLLPRGYNSFFGPSLLDTMLSPAWTTIPSSTSLLRKLLDETTSRMPPMPPSLPYEYMNHEKNVTIRMTLPAGLTTDHVQVQFDQEHHVLTIRGKQEQETPVAAAAEGAESESAMVPRSRSRMEFSQSFALDPDLMQLDQLAAEWSHADNGNNSVLTITVPKHEPPAAAPTENPNIRTIPILTASAQNGATEHVEQKEAAAVH